MVALEGISTNYTFLDGGRYQVLHSQQPLCRTHPFHTLVARDLLIEGRIVVIKQLNIVALPSYEAWQKAHTTLYREIVLLRRIAGPHIAKLLDVFSEGPQLNAIIEYIPGTTLERYIGQRPNRARLCTESEVIDFGLQVYTILSDLHSLYPPIIHRDVKPGNIMRRPEGTYVLIDFGNAREYGSFRSLTGERLWKTSLADTIQGIGSPGYAPPEQYPGWLERLYVRTTPVSDLYGPAVCMHQMLTGKDPTKKDPQKRFSFSSLDGYACPALVNLIGQALQQDERMRPQSAFEIVQRLLEIQRARWTRYQKPHELQLHPVSIS